eukprot:CAMPEP_0202436234 /NCGR_PEP_ID=MMETSP1345-20130828/23719_1 /ASSEMBLY_ACC=CAM_ASM_000843 /TAXON_ID=342563 /ORGANISM="Fabrea Fabrea salina" /LENGTH=648 /DNA_ID=CAMNT_0049049547 /DNA_START=411 /DNA_END=2357 /DNA_ORIENTATION=+
MEELLKLQELNPELTAVNLEFSDIEDFNKILPYLAQFQNLKELILFGNKLESLPEDLSALKNLEVLEISSNQFQSMQSVIPGLCSLPSLKELSITFHTREDQNTLLKALPNLRLLNGALVQDLVGETASEFTEVSSLYEKVKTLWTQMDSEITVTEAMDFEEHVKVLMQKFSKIHKIGPEQENFNIKLLKSKHDVYGLFQDKLVDLVCKLNPDCGRLIQEVNLNMRGFFEDLTSESLDLYLELEHKFPENPKISSEHIKKKYQEEIDELKLELEEALEENKKYLDFIIKHSKASADSAIGAQEDRPFKRPSLSASQNLSVSQEVRNEVSRNETLQSSRALSLRQLKEVIEEIYTSKTKFDKRCADGMLPRETMEQHMYNFLDKKYGLKRIKLEWANAIIQAINRFAGEDNDVDVFRKILNNECDEEFRFVQNQVKQTAAELLKLHLKGKNPLKTNGDITAMANEKMVSYLSESEWTEIVKYMYNENDSTLIISVIKEVIENKNYPSDLPTPKGKLTRGEALQRREKEKALRGRIAYSDFLKILLDFQLKGHEKFLSEFLTVFREVDQETKGALNEKQFREIVQKMDLGLEESDLMRLLQIIDPYDNQQITFSECVALFSTETVVVETSEGNAQVSFLQKLSIGDKLEN